MDSSTFRSFAIVPAAGRSRRMGQAKLLLPWQGPTIIETVLAAWKASQITSATVVVHPEDIELAALCRKCGARVNVVVADPPPEDMKASIRAGLRAITRDCAPADQDVFLIAPADLPGLSTGVIDLLLAAHRQEQAAILVPVHAGHRGHPLLVPWKLAELVFRLPEDAGLNHLLTQQPVREIPAPAAALARDIDTPEDYRAALGE